MYEYPWGTHGLRRREISVARSYNQKIQKNMAAWNWPRTCTGTAHLSTPKLISTGCSPRLRKLRAAAPGYRLKLTRRSSPDDLFSPFRGHALWVSGSATVDGWTAQSRSKGHCLYELLSCFQYAVTRSCNAFMKDVFRTRCRWSQSS